MIPPEANCTRFNVTSIPPGGALFRYDWTGMPWVGVIALGKRGETPRINPTSKGHHA